ncbi:MAG: enoyl-CoA hydratase/isomerase family protein [Actinomycetia bacterium]|nr:enoyl-CoA hydratase/isomerase family protein [Actinomycetes bacterium]
MSQPSDTDSGHVRTSVTRHVGWLEFDRQPMNAFGWAMLSQVGDALDALDEDPEVRVIVFASAVERYFSVGADLEVFAEFDETAMAQWCDIAHDIVAKIRGARCPVLAAIHGVAVGGGLEMTLHCDVRFAATDARLGQPEINTNFIPPVGATQALVRLIGRPAALRYLYSGELLSAHEALELGLVDELVEPESLRATVQANADELCEKPPEALAGIRHAINHGGGMTFEEGLQIERSVAVSLAGTANFTEGVGAFIEKRDPRWQR